MTAKKLNQILAVEKTVKAKREDEFTEIYRAIQKAELVTGMVRAYQPKDDAGEKFPGESKNVQVRVEESLQRTVTLMKEIFNVTAIKDASNCNAKANITIDGEVFVAGVPTPHLLWLEKKLLGLADFISKLPTLPQDIVWKKDDGLGLYRSDPVETIKTKKLEEWKVIVPATPQHPAQTQKMTEDVTVGTWRTTHLSGAIPVDRKKQLLERVERYQRAVKEAREEANQVEVVNLVTGIIVERLFAP